MVPAKPGSTYPDYKTNQVKAFPGFVLVPCGKRQQRDIPSLLDGAGQAALMLGADAGEPAGHYLATLGHKALQQPDIAVGNCVDLLGAELADLLATEELAASAGSAGGPSASRTSAGSWS
jgi:hypothetical protein